MQRKVIVLNKEKSWIHIWIGYDFTEYLIILIIPNNVFRRKWRGRSATARTHQNGKYWPIQIYVYTNGCSDEKAREFHIRKKSDNFREIKNTLGFSNLRLFNSEGVEYFSDDI